MNFYVVSIDDRGIPGQLIACDDFESAKKLCAKFAKENGVKEERIKQEILDDDYEPGSLYGDIAGVWVVACD